MDVLIFDFFYFNLRRTMSYDNLSPFDAASTTGKRHLPDSVPINSIVVQTRICGHRAQISRPWELDDAEYSCRGHSTLAVFMSDIGAVSEILGETRLHQGDFFMHHGSREATNGGGLQGLEAHLQIVFFFSWTAGLKTIATVCIHPGEGLRRASTTSDDKAAILVGTTGHPPAVTCSTSCRACQSTNWAFRQIGFTMDGLNNGVDIRLEELGSRNS